MKIEDDDDDHHHVEDDGDDDKHHVDGLYTNPDSPKQFPPTHGLMFPSGRSAG